MASSIVLYQYLRSPTQFSRVGRLAAYGINANAIGMTAAGYALMAYYLAVFDKGRWRTIGIGGTAVLGLIILATGSRASLAMAVLGGTVLSIPLLKHPGRVLAVAIPLAGLLLAFSGDISAQAIERFGSLENTRSGMWAAGLRHFAASPVIGKGWLSWGRSTANLQNMYLQILAEGGLIGGLLFGAAALAIINLAMSAYRGAKNVVHPTTYLALAFLVSLSVHAVAESALLLGSTVNTLFFGMAIGLLSVSKTQHTSAYRAAVRLSPASRPA
ncbi:O-antigen ligase family protein [Thermostilla marina]